jgi:adenosylcobinamide kinase/adenosylcobinamide-phosphate guanylyltransferase
MGKLTFILGGARSGKTTFAENLASRSSTRVAYIATAQALDDEMAARIEMHRKKRSPGWQTLEIPVGVGRAMSSNPPDAGVIILDCLTLLVSNLMLQAYDQSVEELEHHPNAQNCPGVESQPTGDSLFIDDGMAKAAIDRELDELHEAIRNSPADWILVSNEVGMGLVPPYPQGRFYRDLLGWANQRMASMADRVYFLLAGIPMRLTPEL